MAHNPEGNNGQKPCPPPDEMMAKVAILMRDAQMTDAQLVDAVMQDYDPDVYAMSVGSMRRYRKKYGLLKTRAQHNTVDSIRPYVAAVHERFPTQGVRQTKVVLRQEYDLHVSEKTISTHNRIYEPAAVAARRKHAYIRHAYETPAVGECWSFDQHDKWLRFRVHLHVGLDVYSGKVLWIKAWWTTSNPRIVCSWYLDVIAELGYMPLFTQSDRGTENNGIANAQNLLRHQLMPGLGESLQHRWRGKNRNIKPEILWRILRRGWSKGFETILEQGFTRELYDTSLMWNCSLFHFLFIPWLQSELDKFKRRVNYTKRRADKNVATPRDEPEFIFRRPRDYGSEDWHVDIAPEELHGVRGRYAPPQHPVFDVVEPEFGAVLDECYQQLGRLEMNRRTCWDVYAAMKRAVQLKMPGRRATWEPLLEERLTLWRKRVDDDAIPVLEPSSYISDSSSRPPSDEYQPGGSRQEPSRSSGADSEDELSSADFSGPEDVDSLAGWDARELAEIDEFLVDEDDEWLPPQHDDDLSD
ncbi:hypothetical protein SISSUDRAFT_1067287 [Sistotremastrum suecicum HHB10207 ss-3]|uniref:Integrase core domain-containing protein n=1 Tax=Sistotremastrum suecicum HHB10207 ss-3 TaxID=1314776 RepID=A0A165XA82_9AGAM|nr:hypothetical protein SISSUDRAFT_1067287 [Sistotremastrum suecicum HHB10207 ss-3]